MADESPIQDLDQLRSFLQGPVPTSPKGAGAKGLLPLTKQAAEDVGLGTTILQESRPGVPLQVNPEEGAFGEGVLGNVNPWVRFQTARRQSIEDQQKYLETQFPGKIRKAKNSDDFIIEMTDPTTGKAKDVLLNEEQLTLGDFAAILGKSPELGISLLSMAGAGKIGAIARAPQFAKTLAQLFAGSFGYKAGEAAQQVETRLEQGQSPEVLQTLGQKAKELPSQTALDVGTYGVFKAGNLARRAAGGGPGMFKTAAQTEGLPAEQALRGKFGTGLSYSAAESSGMPLLAFLEAYAAAKPQATAVVEAFRTAQMNEAKALAQAMTVKAGTDEEAGNALLGFLEQNAKAKSDALKAVQATMTKQERDALVKQLGKVAPWSAPIEPSKLGGEFRSDFQTLHQGVKTKVQGAYQAAYGVPGAAMPSVPTKPISDQIDLLAKQFPTVEGSRWMQSYKDTLQPMESYKDIVQRRSDLWNKIEESPADRTTKDYIHGQLSKSMTDTLDDASKNILDPRFRGLIQKANELYKKKELPYYQEGLYDILRKAGQRGSPENIELLDRFRQNTDLYRRLVDVAGKGTKPVTAINTAVIDGILSKSGTTAIDPKFIDGKRLYETLVDVASNKNTREMFNDIFGTASKDVLDRAKILAGMQGTIPKDEAMNLLTSKSPAASRARLRSVLDAQAQMDTVEAKRLLNSPVDQINPEKLVNSYTDKLTETELTKLADRMKVDAPPLYEQMREKQIEQILGKAGTYRTWNQSNIEKVLYDPKWEPKYRAILGDRFEDVKLFAKALGPREQAEKTAEGTGMLVKGESIGALASVFRLKAGGKRGGPIIERIITRAMEEVPGWLGWKYAAKAIQSGAFREWASKDFPAESAKLIPAALISEPILADMANSASSPRIVQQLGMAIRDWTKRTSGTPQEKPDQAPIQDRQELQQFLQR